ncbi:hypothetical protein JB92DRAFT_2835209 [Gautieria morchelliformis]|nr:hypothetical protein JB92DRAFT_2835209 [Gautieria morchelliformis]
MASLCWTCLLLSAILLLWLQLRLLVPTGVDVFSLWYLLAPLCYTVSLAPVPLFMTLRLLWISITFRQRRLHGDSTLVKSGGGPTLRLSVSPFTKYAAAAALSSTAPVWQPSTSAMSPWTPAATLLCCLSLLVSAGVVRFVALPGLGTWRSKILTGFGVDFGHRRSMMMERVNNSPGAFKGSYLKTAPPRRLNPGQARGEGPPVKLNSLPGALAIPVPSCLGIFASLVPPNLASLVGLFVWATAFPPQSLPPIRAP